MSTVNTACWTAPAGSTGWWKQVKALGQPAVAVTDHGVMYGAIEFYNAAKKAGIKPIIGCEVYVAPRTRFDKAAPGGFLALTIWCCSARTRTGYQNLIKLVSAAYIEGFYNKPRVDNDLLRQHHEGLICLSACLAGRDSPACCCRGRL